MKKLIRIPGLQLAGTFQKLFVAGLQEVRMRWILISFGVCLAAIDIWISRWISVSILFLIFGGLIYLKQKNPEKVLKILEQIAPPLENEKQSIAEEKDSLSEAQKNPDENQQPEKNTLAPPENLSNPIPSKTATDDIFLTPVPRPISISETIKTTELPALSPHSEKMFLIEPPETQKKVQPE